VVFEAAQVEGTAKVWRCLLTKRLSGMFILWHVAEEAQVRKAGEKVTALFGDGARLLRK
jgi:hypothetical protein